MSFLERVSSRILLAIMMLPLLMPQYVCGGEHDTPTIAASEKQSEVEMRNHPTGSPTTLPSGWEQIDQRVVFLTVQLASAESSLDAVNKALRVAKYQRTTRQDDAQRYQRGNELMDRNGGGPVRWQEFYTRTAQRFFYHTDVDAVAVTGDRKPAVVLFHSSSYIAARPPEFDYIYRANTQGQGRAEAEVAKLGGRVDALLRRRDELEREQACSWAKIAARAISFHKLTEKPLYRFSLGIGGVDDLTVQRKAAINESALFVRTVVAALTEVEDAVDGDPTASFDALKDVASHATAQLKDRLVHAPKLALDSGDPETLLGRLVASADRLSDVAKNISESHRNALTGTRNDDDQQKQTFRAFLQQALFDCASNVYTSAQCVSELSREWKVQIEVEHPIATTAPSLVAQAKSVNPITSSMNATRTTDPEDRDKATDNRGRVQKRYVPEGNYEMLLRRHDGKVWIETITVNGDTFIQKTSQEVGQDVMPRRVESEPGRSGKLRELPDGRFSLSYNAGTPWWTSPPPVMIWTAAGEGGRFDFKFYMQGDTIDKGQPWSTGSTKPIPARN